MSRENLGRPFVDILDIGRLRCTVPTALKRALSARDMACAFPGGSHRRHVAAHHVRHWADGGETSLENTMLLCSRHHRLVHEGGYAIRRDCRGIWYFRRPDGRAAPAHGHHPDDMVDGAIGRDSDSRRNARIDKSCVPVEAPHRECRLAGEAASHDGVREAGMSYAVAVLAQAELERCKAPIRGRS